MASVIVSVGNFVSAVKAMISSGRLGTEASTIDVGEKSSPTGKKLSGPFEVITVAKSDDSEAVLSLFDGKMEDLLSAALDTVNNSRRLKARAELIEDAKNSPEFRFQLQAKNIFDYAKSGMRPAKQYRPFVAAENFDGLVEFLKQENDEE